MNKSGIGQEGESLNFSVAARAMNTEADAEQIEKYDEYPAKSNPLQYVAVILAIATISLSVYLFKTGHWIFGIIGILVSIFFLLLSFSFGKDTLNKRIAYESGLIIPAIITNTNPIEIISMANMGSREEQEPIYGCLKMKVNALPNHKIEIGEKVPCVSLFGMASNGYRRHFEPRPICWGFKDPNLIPQVVQILNDKPEGTNFADEWEMLYSLKDKMNDAGFNEVVFFDGNMKETAV